MESQKLSKRRLRHAPNAVVSTIREAARLLLNDLQLLVAMNESSGESTFSAFQYLYRNHQKIAALSI